MEHGTVRHDQELIHSFLALRAAVGCIATALPFSLLLVHGRGLDSVSAGYYTDGGSIFVASVCAIGIFLLFYRGYDIRDRIASFVAGGAALFVGLVPCGTDKVATGALAWGWGARYAASVCPGVHLLAAAVLFLVLALFCLWLFPMSDGPSHTNRKKDLRNAVYYFCGAAIVICLGRLFAHFAFDRLLVSGGVFWLETAMLLAFGLSWAVKGEGIGFLNDRGAAVAERARGSSRRAQ